MVEFGPRGLICSRRASIRRSAGAVAGSDEQRESRQVGIIDMKGRTAAHTGKQNNAWAGSRQGKTYTTQANIMVGPKCSTPSRRRSRRAKGTGCRSPSA
jgi:Uncharacterized conserved protein